MRKLFSALALAVCMFSFQASAATLTLQAGTLSLQVLSNVSDNAIVAFDVRGVSGFSLLDGVTNSIVIIEDGTNLGFPAPAVPNNLMIATDGPVQTQGLVLQFINARLGGSGILVDAIFSSNLFPVNKPELQYFANNTVTFDFSFVDAALINGDTQTLSNWVGVSGFGPDTNAVPEPSSMLMIGGGLLACGFFVRKR